MPQQLSKVSECKRYCIDETGIYKFLNREYAFFLNFALVNFLHPARVKFIIFWLALQINWPYKVELEKNPRNTCGNRERLAMRNLLLSEEAKDD